jgi:hypothetical protein
MLGECVRSSKLTKVSGDGAGEGGMIGTQLSM